MSISRDFKPHLQLANAQYLEGRFDEAEDAYHELRSLDPDHIGVLTRLGELELWKNRTAEAERYLTAAWRNTSWREKQWPFSSQLNTLLAMTYYRQNRFPEAASYFKRAAGPGGLGPYQYLKAMSKQLDLFDERPPYLNEGPGTARIPFTVTDPLPVIQVAVNGSELLPFFIDTGGAEVIIDDELAGRVGAISAGTQKGEGGGTTGSLGLGKVDSLTIGEVVIKNVPIHTLDARPFAAVFDGMPVKGVIGTRLLMRFLATIDYAGGSLVLRQKSSSEHVDFRPCKMIPFWLIQSHYIVANGILNGKGPMLFFVDTGLAGIGFSATESLLQEAGIAVDWTKAEAGIAGFGKTETVDVTADELALGAGENRVVARNLPGAVFKTPIEVLGDKLGFRVGGVVSHQFFRDYALTLDFERMRLILQGPA